MALFFHTAAGISYITAFFGFLIGSLFIFVLKRKSNGFQGVLMGVCGGLLLAYVCFGLLPAAFLGDGFYYAIGGILLGVCVAVFLENKIRGGLTEKTSHKLNTMTMGILLSVGIAVHMAAEGMSIGSFFKFDTIKAYQLCLIIGLHCIPEGMTVALALKMGGFSFIKTAVFFSILSLPMALGGFLGSFVFGSVGYSMKSFCFAFAGGVMLYIACGEILPQSRRLWQGRLITAGALAGFLFGIIFITGL